jgi:hypothetical protein
MVYGLLRIAINRQKINFAGHNPKLFTRSVNYLNVFISLIVFIARSAVKRYP